MYLWGVMSKSKIILLTIFVTLLLLAIITVQFIWINNAFKVKERNFDQLVYMALTNVVFKIERNENRNMLNEELGTGDPDAGFPYNRGNFQADTSEGFYVSQNFKILKNGKSATNDSLEPNQGESGVNQPLSDKVFQKRISNRKLIINQILMHMYSKTPEIEDRVNPRMIDTILEKELHQNGITTHFEYGVVKWNHTLAFSSKGFKTLKDQHQYNIRLFPDDFYDSANLLSVYFPDRRNFIIRIYSNLYWTPALYFSTSVAIRNMFTPTSSASSRRIARSADSPLSTCPAGTLHQPSI